MSEQQTSQISGGERGYPLIYYIYPDPILILEQLTGEEKEGYNLFLSKLNLMLFKDFIKRCRHLFLDKVTDKKIFPKGFSRRELVVQAVVHPIMYESILGTFGDVKGPINETLRQIYYSKDQVEEADLNKPGDNQQQAQCHYSLLCQKKINGLVVELIEKALKDYHQTTNELSQQIASLCQDSKQQEKQQQLASMVLHNQDKLVQVLNNMFQLLDTLSSDQELSSKEVVEIVIQKCLPCFVEIQQSILKVTKEERLQLKKHVDLVGLLMLRMYQSFQKYIKLIPEQLQDQIQQLCEAIISLGNKFTKDIMSQASLISMKISLETKKVLNSILQYIQGSSAGKKQFQPNEKLQDLIFDSVYKNLDYSVNKLLYQLKDVLQELLETCADPQIAAQKYAKRMLELNVAHNRKKFFILNVLSTKLPYDWLINHCPHIVYDLFVSCGDFPRISAQFILEQILKELYNQKYNKNVRAWADLWVSDFFKCVLQYKEFKVVKGIIALALPILSSIDKGVIAYLIEKILKKTEGEETNLLEKNYKNQNLLWCFINLLKQAREKGMIQESADACISIQGTIETINKDQVSQLLFNSDTNIAINILNFLTVSNKPSEVPSAQEFQLVTEFIKYCNSIISLITSHTFSYINHLSKYTQGTRTSNPEYRKDFYNSLRKFFERLRLVYDKDLISLDRETQALDINQAQQQSQQPQQQSKQKTKPKKKNFDVFTKFIQDICNCIFDAIYPGAPFEIMNPLLEILKILLQNFNPKSVEYRKGLTYEPTMFLAKQITNRPLFSKINYEMLLLGTQQQWDSIRQLSLDVLEFFPSNLPFFTDEYVELLFKKAIQMCRDPIIKLYESGAHLLSLLFNSFLNRIIKLDILVISYGEAKIDQLQKQPDKQEQKPLLMEVAFLEQLRQLLEYSYHEFEKNFLVDWNNFQNNFLHGIITALSYVISKIPASTYRKDQEQFKQFFTRLLLLITEILAFSTHVSSENVSTFVLDNQKTNQMLVEEKEKKIKSFDCRGHPIVEKEAKEKDQFLKNFEKVFNSNANIQAMDTSVKKNQTGEQQQAPKQQIKRIDFSAYTSLGGEGEGDEIELGQEEGKGEGDSWSENLFVIAFYLITREAGLLFMKIADVVGLREKEKNCEVLDPSTLQTVTYQFFNSLLNLKHIGSYDRISQGLETLCCAMNEGRAPLLPNLSTQLLERLLSFLEQNAFKNVLRRSAGLPNAIVCLVKSESAAAGNRKRAIAHAMSRLTVLAQRTDVLEIRIHALNILKLLFQDTNLKSELDRFVSQGFIIAIKGFAVEDWSVRNSSLMLFSSLALRTVGSNRNANVNSIKQKINLVEFFSKATELFDFFFQEISDYSNTNQYQDSLYPPLYPIAVIFTRLLPYNLKNSIRCRIYDTDVVVGDEEEGKVQQEEGNQHEEITEAQKQRLEDESSESLSKNKQQQLYKEYGTKYVSLEDVQKMLPLLVLCGRTKNYMGRVMVARSIFPFLNFEQVPQQSTEFLARIESLQWVRKNHNFTHGLLLQILYSMKNYYEIKNEASIQFDEKQSEHFVNQERELLIKIVDKDYLLCTLDCATIHEIHKEKGKGKIIFDNLKKIDDYAESSVSRAFSQDSFRIQNDMGHSVLRKRLIKYLLRKQLILNEQKSEKADIVLQNHIKLITQLALIYLKNNKLCEQEDSEIFQLLLKEFISSFNFIVNDDENLLNVIGERQDKFEEFVQVLLMLLGEQGCLVPYFSNCIRLIFKLLIKLNIAFPTLFSQEKLKNLPFFKIFPLFESKFKANSQLMKQFIKLTGVFVTEGLISKEFFENIVSEYSNAGQLEYIRVGVVKSLKVAFKKLLGQFFLPFMSSTNEQVNIACNIQDYKLYLRFCKTLIRLIQDESDHIRQKTANLVNKVFFKTSLENHPQQKKSYQKKYSGKINFEVMLMQFFEFISANIIGNQYLREQNDIVRETMEFFLHWCFEGDFFEIKKMNNKQKRIFQFDKANKFQDDLRLKRLALKQIVQLQEKLANITQQILTNEYLDKFAKNGDKGQGYSFLQLTEDRVQKYALDFTIRDEFEFENILNLAIYEFILARSKAQKQPSSFLKKYICDPVILTFFENL